MNKLFCRLKRFLMDFKSRFFLKNITILFVKCEEFNITLIAIIVKIFRMLIFTLLLKGEG